MPLEFHSKSHKQVVFGFFNIETDLLLLEKYFFFAHQFCNMVDKIAESSDHEIFTTNLDAYFIDNPLDIGNLMGAINGTDFRGFIGQVYKLFPFPESLDDFKQNPEGFENRHTVKELLMQWAQPVQITIELNPINWEFKIGEFLFTMENFHEIVAYVWYGGMPKWKNFTRPDYVVKTIKIISKSESPAFCRFRLKRQ